MRLLYNTLTERLQPYNRTDDEDVHELSPEYLIMQVIDSDPPPYDTEKEIRAPTQTVDVGNQTVTNGWEIKAKPAPIQFPVAVTMRSLRLALIDAGLYQYVVGAINGIPDAQERLKAQVWWSSSPIVRRDNSYVTAIGAAVGKTTQEIDQLFLSAQTLDLS